MRPSIHNRSGFTLIEALITIAFFSMCVAAFFTFVISVKRSHEALVSQAEHILVASRVGLLLKDENVCKGTNIVRDLIIVNDTTQSLLKEYEKFEISNKGHKFVIYQSGESNGVTFSPLRLNVSKQPLGSSNPHLIASLKMNSTSSNSTVKNHNMPIVLTLADSNKQILSCYANYSLERTCKDLGMQFHYNQTPVCAP